MRTILLAVALLAFLVSTGYGRVGGGEIVFPVKTPGNAVFSHDFHVADAGFSCTDCHDRIYVTRQKDKRVTMTEMRKEKSCGACHNGEKAFSVKADCNRCHKKK